MQENNVMYEKLHFLATKTCRSFIILTLFFDSLMVWNIHICGIYFFRYKNMVILTKIVKTRRLKVQIKVGLKNWSFQDLPRNISLNFDCRKSRHQDSPAEGAINLYKSQLTIFRAGYFYYVNGRGAKNIPLGSTQKWCQMFV